MPVNTFVGATDGAWMSGPGNPSDNWSLGTTPGTSDDVVIASPPGGFVFMEGDTVALSLTLSNVDLDFNFYNLNMNDITPGAIVATGADVNFFNVGIVDAGSLDYVGKGIAFSTLSGTWNISGGPANASNTTVTNADFSGGETLYVLDGFDGGGNTNVVFSYSVLPVLVNLPSLGSAISTPGGFGSTLGAIEIPDTTPGGV